MGQKLFEDKIGALTEAGGTISLASGSRLTIGGQQFVTTSTLQDTPAGLATETWYRIYAVLSGGVPILAVSANNNITGPAGEDAWKLVGHFFSGLSGAVNESLSRATEDGHANLKPIKSRVWFDTGSQTLVTSVRQEIAYSAISYDDHDIAESSRRFVIPRDGNYTFYANFYITAPGTASRMTVQFRKDTFGGTILSNQLHAMNINGTSTGNARVSVDLLKGDKVLMTGVQETGVNQTLVTAVEYANYFEMKSNFPNLILDEDL